MTATCARLAASATRVKSLRKASVDGDVGSWAGGCGTAGCAMALAGDDCCVEDRWPDETAREPMGEVIGAFMLCDGVLLHDGGEGVDDALRLPTVGEAMQVKGTVA